MTVTGIGRTSRPTDPDLGRVHASRELVSLLPEADYVVVAAPLTEETRGMVDAAAFERMKPSARLINVARGPIVVEAALADARASERRWLRGEPKGILDGVPVSIKDLLVTKGWPTLRGSW